MHIPHSVNEGNANITRYFLSTMVVGCVPSSPLRKKYETILERREFELCNRAYKELMSISEAKYEDIMVLKK